MRVFVGWTLHTMTSQCAWCKKALIKCHCYLLRIALLDPFMILLTRVRTKIFKINTRLSSVQPKPLNWPILSADTVADIETKLLRKNLVTDSMRYNKRAPKTKFFF